MYTKYYNFKEKYNLDNLNECIRMLSEGNIGIFPTDTVYGIGSDALNINGINSLFNVKKRDYSKPINILVSNLSMIQKLVKDINPIEMKLIEKFWPGELTIIFDKSNLVSDLLTSGLPTVGIRMPNNKICLDLINKLGNPIATSSANISNELPATDINKKLIENFSNNVGFIIDSGKLETGIPSTIVRVEDDEIKILREGPISLKDIMEAI